jgi:hypothetical protein
MRVAVLGSWRQEDKKSWGLLETPEEFRDACRKVGAELIRRGHSLIVGTDSGHTADGNAARGAIDALREDETTVESPRIMLIRPESRDPERPFLEMRRSNPGVFIEHEVDSASWAAVKLVQTQLADAVILIGGAEKTEQAGLTAAVSRKPLGCIGSFGGAAAALNKRFKASPAAWGYKREETASFPRLQEPFSDVVLKTALEAAWIEGAPKLMIIHGRSPDRDLFKEYLLKYVGRVIVLADEFTPTEPIPLKFERFASSVDGAIALLTPDDVGGLAAEPAVAAPRARENVWVEVGWFWGHRSRSKLLLLRKGPVTIPSDLGNVEHYEYTSGPEDPAVESKIQAFITRLRSASEADGFEG